jgi:hypothetical protein
MSCHAHSLHARYIDACIHLGIIFVCSSCLSAQSITALAHVPVQQSAGELCQAAGHPSKDPPYKVGRVSGGRSTGMRTEPKVRHLRTSRTQTQFEYTESGIVQVRPAKVESRGPVALFLFDSPPKQHRHCTQVVIR